MADVGSDQLWRDPDGVVHLDATEGELPASLEAAIVTYLAAGDWDEAYDRHDQLRDLLTGWHDAAVEEAAQSQDVPVGEACERVDGDEPRPVSPDVVAALEPLRDEPSIGRRLNLLDDALRLVDEWLDYRLDPEKLVGHLILGHGIAMPLATFDQISCSVDMRVSIVETCWTPMIGAERGC